MYDYPRVFVCVKVIMVNNIIWMNMYLQGVFVGHGVHECSRQFVSGYAYLFRDLLFLSFKVFSALKQFVCMIDG